MFRRAAVRLSQKENEPMQLLPSLILDKQRFKYASVVYSSLVGSIVGYILYQRAYICSELEEMGEEIRRTESRIEILKLKRELLVLEYEEKIEGVNKT